MSDGALKPEKDFSKEVDKQVPEAEKLAQVRMLYIAPGTRDIVTDRRCRPTCKAQWRSSQH